MSEAVWITLITAIATIITVYLEKGRRDSKAVRYEVQHIKRDAQVAREQTTNTHESNLRDDLDAKHDETMRRFNAQDEHNEKVLKALGGLDRSDKQQWTIINELRRQRRKGWFT